MMPRSHLRSRRWQRGQSLIEFGATLPVLILLFLGALDINTFTADIQTAVSATRQAARLSSILGSQVCSTPPLTWIDVDTIIVEDVRAIASTMNAASLNEIDIYRPDNGTGYGAYRPGLDTHVDRFNGTGMLISQAFPLSERIPIAPDEASIGINLKWTFTHINNQGGVGSVTLNTYSVFKVLAVPTGC